MGQTPGCHWSWLNYQESILKKTRCCNVWNLGQSIHFNNEMTASATCNHTYENGLRIQCGKDLFALALLFVLMVLAL